MTKTVDTLSIDTMTIIEKINAPNPLKMRLLSFGFLKGSLLKVVSVSMGKETLVVKLNNKTQYALRHEEAKHIVVTANIESK